MQFPDDWGKRPRQPTAHASTEAQNTLNPKDLALARSDLTAFAASATKRSLSLRKAALHAITSNPATIADRIESLLPANDEPDAKNASSSMTADGTAPRRCEMHLELDTLLSRLPYKELMRELAPSSTDKPLPSVPIVSRQYEETFMREKIHASERECCMGDECECRYIDPMNAFTAIEFVLPDEPQSDTPRPCVLCSRATTQQLFYDIVFDNANFHGLIQRHGNLYGVHNEYAKDAVLVCPPDGPLHAMPHPIVKHQRTRYSVVRTSGVRSIRQHGVHFQ